MGIHRTERSHEYTSDAVGIAVFGPIHLQPVFLHFPDEWCDQYDVRWEGKSFKTNDFGQAMDRIDLWLGQRVLASVLGFV